MARGVQAEIPGRRLGQAETVDIEGLQVQRPRTVGIDARVVLEPEGSAVDELRLRPCRRIDQIQVTGHTVTGYKQKAGGTNVQDILWDAEVTQVGQSLLVVTTGRKRDCLRGRCAGGR